MSKWIAILAVTLLTACGSEDPDTPDGLATDGSVGFQPQDEGAPPALDDTGPSPDVPALPETHTSAPDVPDPPAPPCDDPSCTVVLADTTLGGTISEPGKHVILSGTVTVAPMGGGSGTLRIEAASITVEGTIDARGAGHPGAGGGGGGGGGSRQAPHGASGTGGSGAQSGSPGGGDADCGSTKFGAPGGVGGTGSGPYAGALGADGACNPTHNDPGEPGGAGGSGGYAGPGVNGDTSSDAAVTPGSGGGGGGGGSGGGNGNGEGGGGGGGGGAGGAGGGAVLLLATHTLTVSGNILTAGTRGGAGDPGTPNQKTGDKTGAGGNGGDGADAAVMGGGKGGPGGVHEGQGTDGGDGGPGGAGAGGGVLLSCERDGGLLLGGTVDARGGAGSTINGGTVKIRFVGTPPPVDGVVAGRIDVRALDGTPTPTPPVVMILQPGPGTTTAAAAIDVSGTSSVTSGAVVSVFIQLEAGGSFNPCTGTAEWLCGGMPLVIGPNTLTVQAWDDAGLVGTAIVVVTRTPATAMEADIFDPQREPWRAEGPVSIVGNRFVVGGEVYYPKTDFLTAVPPGDDIKGWNTHGYLGRSAGDQKTIRDALVASEYNAIYLYTLNQGDYGASGSHPQNRVTPYGSGGWSFDTGSLNSARVAQWQTALDTLLDAQLKPVIWLAADDSPAIAGASLSKWQSYVQHMVTAFEGYPVIWVVGLEVDEYWSAAQVAERRQALMALTKHPVGVHLTTSETKVKSSPYTDGFDFVMGQLSSPQQNAAYISQVSAYSEKDRPWVASEFNVAGKGSGGEAEGTVTARSKAIGAVIAGVGAPPLVSGLGNGIALGEADPPPPDDPPELPADLKGVQWLHKDVSGWAVTGNLESVNVSGSKICLDYDKASAWPGKQHLGLVLNANPWIFIHQGGTWYAATWEWMKVGQTCKNKSAVAGDHIKKDPLWEFSPKSGTAYYFMVSGLARDSATNVSERTNIVKVVWP